MENEILFTVNGRGGRYLKETATEDGFVFEYFDGKKSYTLPLYDTNGEYDVKRNPYLGFTMDDVLASGRDLLGEIMIKNGDPDYKKVKSALPKITENAYCFLGAPTTPTGVMIDASGKIYPQRSGRDQSPEPIFDPAIADPLLCMIPPSQRLLGGEYPILISSHTNDIETVEFLYFVEPGCSDKDPVVWIREKRFWNSLKDVSDVQYRIATIGLDCKKETVENARISEDIFLDTLLTTVAYWIRYNESGTVYDLPNTELMHVANGAMGFAALTFTGPQAHYGHKYYGYGFHDNFPPNYIWMLECALVSGREAFAKEVFDYLLAYVIDENGRFYYRQGLKMLLGSSAVEYSMIIYLASKYRRALGVDSLDALRLDKLVSLGDTILENYKLCPEFGNRYFIKMCAEADNNVRVNVYLNNNLWAIRGLNALADILGETNGAKYKNAAHTLEQNINSLIEEHATRDSAFGDVVPFRFGYPTIPYTLSNCEAYSAEVDAKEKERYLMRTFGRRDFDVTDQEITENTYANYRYYPEILSAMLLPENYAKGIAKMRDELGGNLLGMTRLRSWVDDWPVLNYAKYLLETCDVEKYILLLYAHTALHGHPELICYYEQFKIHGAVSAHDCVPSLLTTPLMLAFAFAYERTRDSSLSLLSAIPKEWYSKSFGARDVGYSGGKIDFAYENGILTVDFDKACECDFEITLRRDGDNSFEVTSGGDFVDYISENKIFFKKGARHIEISLK